MTQPQPSEQIAMGSGFVKIQIDRPEKTGESENSDTAPGERLEYASNVENKFNISPAPANDFSGVPEYLKKKDPTTSSILPDELELPGSMDQTGEINLKESEHLNNLTIDEREKTKVFDSIMSKDPFSPKSMMTAPGGRNKSMETSTIE